MWSLVTYSHYFKIKFNTVELAKVCLCLVLFNTVIINTIPYVDNNDHIHGIIFAVPGFWILEYKLL